MLFNRLKLSLKFVIILSIVFIASMLLSGVLLSRKAQHLAQTMVDAKATTLMAMVNAVRSYTNEQVQPLLIDRVNASPTFIPEVIPSYAARQAFEGFRTQGGYTDYRYKDATLNPTNPRDQANEFETSLINQFRQNPELEELSGFHQVEDKNLYYIARPFKILQPTCLRCHSTPDRAPKSQIATYGADRGFGWKLNEVITAQTVYVPGEELFQSYRQQLLLTFGVFAGIVALGLGLLNLLLNRIVIRPIVPMARLTQKITYAQDEDTIDLTEVPDFKKLDTIAHRSDELGQLAGLLRQMTIVIADRERAMHNAVKRLRSEKESALKAITNSQFNSVPSITALIQRSQRSRLKHQPQQPDLKTLLQQVPPFQPFSDRALERLIELGYQIHFEPQEIICQEDDPGGTFYYILAGSVEFYVESLQRLLRVQKAGSFFGELSLLLNVPRTATVRTLEPTRLFAINQTGFRTLLQEYPQLAEAITRQLSTYRTELEQRKESLQRHQLLHDEKTFAQNPLAWIRDRIQQLFGV